MEKVTMATYFETYGPSSIRDDHTMTVEELSDVLDEFNPDDDVIISFDGGYTYGGISYDDFEEDIDEDTGEAFLMINVVNCSYSIDNVSQTMTVQELIDCLSDIYPALKVVFAVRAFRSSRLFSGITTDMIDVVNDDDDEYDDDEVTSRQVLSSFNDHRVYTH